MGVFVVMGNDFPDAVFSKEELANAYIAKKKAEEKPDSGMYRRIHWRAYEFNLDNKLNKEHQNG